MHVLEKRDHRDRRTGREAEHRAEHLGGPHRVLRRGPHPQTEAGRAGREGHLLIPIRQVIREPRGAEHVIAQLVAHRRDHARVEQGRREGCLDESPQHQDGFDRRSHREERDASAHRQRLPPVTPPPGPDGRVRDEHGDQQQTQLTDRHPGIAHALGDDGDGVTEEPDMSQRGDLQVAQVRRRTEVEQQSQRQHAAGCPRQPQPPRPQVEPHERDDRHDHHPGRHMRPTQGQAELSGRLRSHHRQFAPREGCGPRRRQGKEQMGPRAASPGPDQQMHGRQRETRRRDHGPDDRDPAHGEGGRRRRGARALRHRHARWRVTAAIAKRRSIATPTPCAKAGA